MIAESIKSIYKQEIKVNSLIKISGWIKSRRDSKMGFSFLNIYDGSSLLPIQVIVTSAIKNYYKEVLFLTTGCSVIVTGTLVFSKGLKQTYEIQANLIKVIGWVQNPSKYPISSKRHSLEYLREFAHLRPRTNIFGVICRLRSCIANILHNFFYSKNFYWVPTPIITSLNAEGAGTMFRVSTLDLFNISNKYKNKLNYKKDFFGKESFLTVSGQLTLETHACALSKAYTFGPIFRAENSNTSRHLSEFWMLEVEQSFTSLDDIIALSESMLKEVLIKVLDACQLDIDFLEKNVDCNIKNRINQFIENKLIQIEYSEAVEILIKSDYFFKKPVYWGIDFSAEHERFLVEKYFSRPVVIKNYPKEIKAFYMRLNKDEKTVAAMDILVPIIGELIGGSQREERLKILDDRITEFNLNIDDYWWYRDLRKYGTVPHSGFGLGFERLLCYITGLNNVRDVVPFPRTSNNADF